MELARNEEWRCMVEQVRSMYLEFIRSGFTEKQAMELIKSTFTAAAMKK